MIDKLNSSKKLPVIIYAAVFMFMAILNFLTPKCVDDYAYMISLVTIKPITKLSEIFPSLYDHAFSMNGRLVAHFFVYLFDMLPKAVFNIVNAAMFLLLIILCAKMGNENKKPGALCCFFVFCSLWLFEHDFGQVNLWLTGSCNYLWGVVFALLYLLPFYKLFKNGASFCGSKETGRKKSSENLKGTLFVIYGLLAGAYNEITCSSMVFISILLILASAFLRGYKIKWYHIAAVIAAIIGFISMFLAPAQSAKAAESIALSEKLKVTLKMFLAYWPLIIAWIFFFVLKLTRDKRLFKDNAVLLSLIFLLGSLAANFVLIFAASYSGRCAVSSLVYLLIAVLLLLNNADGNPWKTIAVIFIAILIPFTVYNMIFGVYDIIRTGREMNNNIATIQAAVKSGNTSVEIPYVYPSTKYSAIYNLKYLDLERSDIWPNENMATYFGINEIIALE